MLLNISSFMSAGSGVPARHSAAQTARNATARTMENLTCRTVGVESVLILVAFPFPCAFHVSVFDGPLDVHTAQVVEIDHGPHPVDALFVGHVLHDPRKCRIADAFFRQFADNSL